MKELTLEINHRNVNNVGKPSLNSLTFKHIEELANN
jgi:hypothetical protein